MSPRVLSCHLLGLGVVLCFCFSVKADDMGQMMPGQEGAEETYRELYEGTEGDSSSFVQGDGLKRDDLKNIEKEKSFAIPGDSDERNTLPIDARTQDPGVGVMGAVDNQKTYIEYIKEDVVAENFHKADSSFHIAYIKDDFSYEDPNGVFKRTFVDPDDSAQNGMLLIKFDKYFYRSWFHLGVNLGAGVGHTSGRGIFAGGTESDVDFLLWTLPVDLGLTLELPLGRWAKIFGSAGPSAMGIIQNRSDRDKGEEDKTRRQISHGTFYEAGFSLNLSPYFDDIAFDMFAQYEVTSMYLTLKLRSHNYENFQDEFSISGQSYGLGLSFDYL